MLITSRVRVYSKKENRFRTGKKNKNHRNKSKNIIYNIMVVSVYDRHLHIFIRTYLKYFSNHAQVGKQKIYITYVYNTVVN